MFRFDDFARIASAAICSLVLTTVLVGAAADAAGTSGAVSAVYASAATSETAHG